VPATDETPRARDRRHEHPKAHRRTPQHASRAAHQRKPAKSERKSKPAGDREAAHAAYQRGNSELLSDNDAAAAVAAYQEAVRLAPGDPSGYRGLGLAYEKQGKVPDAITALVTYLKLSKHAHDREVIARRLYRLTHPHDE
jgi:Flp pilus assembly protein TadD